MGSPRGPIFSPLLFNVYMRQLGEIMKRFDDEELSYLTQAPQSQSFLGV